MVDYPLFWAQFQENLTDRSHPFFGRRPEDTRKNEFNISAGRNGFTWKFKVNQRDATAAIELYIDITDKPPQITQRAYERLRSQKTVIEQTFGEPLLWDDLEDDTGEHRPVKRRRIRHILYAKETVDVEDISTWNEVQAAMIHKMRRLYHVFTPYIRQFLEDEALG